MQFTLVIELGNPAMTNGDHVREAIRESLRGMPSLELGPGDGLPIHDENGNTVGWWQVDQA